MSNLRRKIRTSRAALSLQPHAKSALLFGDKADSLPSRVCWFFMMAEQFPCNTVTFCSTGPVAIERPHL
jgi:hypothetical protein